MYKLFIILSVLILANSSSTGGLLLDADACATVEHLNQSAPKQERLILTSMSGQEQILLDIPAPDAINTRYDLIQQHVAQHMEIDMRYVKIMVQNSDEQFINITPINRCEAKVTLILEPSVQDGNLVKTVGNYIVNGSVLDFLIVDTQNITVLDGLSGEQTVRIQNGNLTFEISSCSDNSIERIPATGTLTIGELFESLKGEKDGLPIEVLFQGQHMVTFLSTVKTHVIKQLWEFASENPDCSQEELEKCIKTSHKEEFDSYQKELAESQEFYSRQEELQGVVSKGWRWFNDDPADL